MSMHSTAMDIGAAFDMRGAGPGSHDHVINQNSFSRSQGTSWAVKAASETGEMRKVLRSASVTLGSSGNNWRSSARADHRLFTREESRAAQGSVATAVKDDLQAVHYKLGEDMPGAKHILFDWYETSGKQQERTHWDASRMGRTWAPAPESPNMRTRTMGTTMRTRRTLLNQ
mmetsp:Transcript_91193/g.162404  ORF Transcript_91193/g.162404 Transcript_91193/m.162404 type:complete len:172 (-) Transcript_91193:52-567(-)